MFQSGSKVEDVKNKWGCSVGVVIIFCVSGGDFSLVPDPTSTTNVWGCFWGGLELNSWLENGPWMKIRMRPLLKMGIFCS